MSVTLRLRSDQLVKLRTLAGITTDNALAESMRMDPATVSRVLRGKQTPGPRFMAALVDCFHGWDLDDLFEVVPAEAA